MILTVLAYLRMASVAGIPPRDALLLLTPGQVFEAFDLYLQAHGLKRRDEE